MTSRITYHLEQARGGTVDSVIADPFRATDLSGQSWIWQAGLGVERKLLSRQTTHGVEQAGRGNPGTPENR